MTAIKQKREWAKLLYLKTSMSQKEIAEHIHISEKTLSKWVNDDKEKWTLLKSSVVITKDQELRRIYTQILELNNAIEIRESGKRYATTKEADTLVKLATAAKALESDASIAQIIDVFVGFTNFIRDASPDKCKEFIMLQDAYIKSKLNKA